MCGPQGDSSNASATAKPSLNFAVGDVLSADAYHNDIPGYARVVSVVPNQYGKTLVLTLEVPNN